MTKDNLEWNIIDTEDIEEMIKQQIRPLFTESFTMMLSNQRLYLDLICHLSIYLSFSSLKPSSYQISLVILS